MVDKLILLSPEINERFAKVAREHGIPAAGYERRVDLRKTHAELPVMLFCGGRHNGWNKVEIIGVARLGFPRTQEIVERIFPNLQRVRIFRIDLCVDLLGFLVWFFVTSLYVPRRQNYRLYRSRGAVSYYLVFSKQRILVFYDRLRLMRKEKDPLADIYMEDDRLTRVELQLSGSAVPFKRFADLYRYAEIHPMKHVRMAKLLVDVEGQTPVKRLTGYGLLWLISKYGLQATSRMFSSPEWAALKKAYLKEVQDTQIPQIGSLMRKSIRRWLKGRIVFPRAPDRESA
jgi:hypothetical protein